MNRIVKYILLILGVMLILTSCGMVYKVNCKVDVSTYIGQSYEEITEKFGPPTREYQNNTGTVLVYEGTPEIFNYSYAYEAYYGIPIAKFHINEDGICYNTTLHNVEGSWAPNGRDFLSLLLAAIILGNTPE